MTPSDRGGLARASESPTGHAAAKAALRELASHRRAARRRPPGADAARLHQALAACAGHAAVACYASIGDEPTTWALIEALRAGGVRVLLPVLAGRRTPAWAWHTGPEALRRGFLGIPEPTGPALGPDALRETSFVWASALLAAPDGVRLGTGGGWYDRALTYTAPAARVGVLLDDDEVVDALPCDPWDHRVDVLVTPSRTLPTGAAQHGSVE